MSGRLILGQITSDGEKRATKIDTWFLKKFNSLDLLDENYFNEFSKKHNLFKEKTEDKKVHYDYENDMGMFAPYYYGILLIDFKNKKVYSCNNYNGFLSFGIENVKNDYEKIGIHKQTIIEMHDMKGNITHISIFEENKFELPTPRMIESCIRKKGTMYVDGKEYPIKKEEDYFSVAAKLYGQDLSLLSYEKAKSYIKNNRMKDSSDIFSLNGWNNIEIKLDGWEIINGDKSFNYFKEAYDYYSKNQILNDKEKDIWLEEIKETEEKESD
jgi:hypothetical protein